RANARTARAFPRSNPVLGSIKNETGAALMVGATNGATGSQSAHPGHTHPESEAWYQAGSAPKPWHHGCHSPEAIALSDLRSKSGDPEFRVLPPCAAWKSSGPMVSRPCRIRQSHRSKLPLQH